MVAFEGCPVRNRSSIMAGIANLPQHIIPQITRKMGGSSGNHHLSSHGRFMALGFSHDTALKSIPNVF